MNILQALTRMIRELYTGPMRESNFQTLWKGYLLKNPPTESEAHELKLCKSTSFPFSSVNPNQIDCLRAVEKGFYYKISDMAAISGFASPKPFDNFWMTKTKGYVVICFYQPRKYKKVFKIPVEQFVAIRDNWPRKSIRMDDLTLKFKPIEL